jgi:electron transfer flavoprotein beta subunit
MKQVVCLKVTPKVDQIRFDDTKKTVVREGVENEIDDADKNALEMALSLKDKLGGSVTVVSMGPPAFEPFLRLAVAMGADDAVLLSDRGFAGSDTFATSRVLAEAIRKLESVDMVYCGEASADGSTEQVPPSIAQWLDIPGITYVTSLDYDGVAVRAKRDIRGGYEIVQVKPPLLLSVELGCNTPRFPDFRRKRWADKEFKPKVWGMQELGLQQSQVGNEGSLTTVTELRNMRSAARKNEQIEGTNDQVISRLMQLLVEAPKG